MMMRTILGFLLLTGLVLGGQSKVVTKVKSDEAKQIRVEAKVEDNTLKLTIEKDGDVNEFELDLSDENAVAALEEALEELEVDLNVKGLLSGKLHMFAKEKGGYLGVQLQNMTDQLRDYFGMKGDGGALVTEVVDDSPAEKAGLKAGDVVVKVNDETIDDSSDLSRTIGDFDPDTQVAITVLRKGREKKLKVTLGEREMDRFGFMNQRFRKSMKHSPGDLNKMMFWFDDDEEDMEHHMMIYPRSMDKDLDKLREELENLKKEIEKLKDS